MEVYHYDKLTGELTNQTEATRSPLFDPSIHDPSEEFLIPSNAATLVPPTVGDNEVICFINNTWEKKVDYRETVLFTKATGQQIEITEIGITPDETMVSTAPKQYEEWDEVAGNWALSRALWLTGEVRSQRDHLLDRVDIRKCNAESWGSMSQATKDAWAVYKQELRDLPDVIEPTTQIWPTPPS